MEKKKKKYSVKVISERCKGCTLCIDYCKTKALKLSDKPNKMGYLYAEADPQNECSGCMLCTLVCPDLEIEVYGE